MLRSVHRVLQQHGYEVVPADGGEAAHELFKSETFNVVLSDISMPGWDGIRLLRSLREVDHDVPVVLITGEPAVKTAVQALEYGAFRYLTKPLDMHRLQEVVDKAAAAHRMTLMKREAAELLGHGPQHKLKLLEDRFNSVLESLWMAYQPIVKANSGNIFGFEALLRSNEHSMLDPSDVLDAAEKLRQLDALGRTIRDRAALGMDQAPEDTALFVNLHTTDLLDPMLTSADAPLSKLAHRVVLEITERSSLQHIRDVRGRIALLREMGFRIAVDDLGAGYAGLSSFALLEPDIVKLDMSLVREVHSSQTRQKLIRSMTDLCKDMGMLVVAEGVESKEEKDALVELGCDLLQGFMFAKPAKAFPKVDW